MGMAHMMAPAASMQTLQQLTVAGAPAIALRFVTDEVALAKTYGNR